MITLKRKLLKSLLCLLLLTGTKLSAEVKLPAFFSDHMVLQRDMSVPIWGTAKDGEKITVSFQDQNVSTTASNGRWMVRLNPLKAGGPFELKVIGENTVTVGDVLVGEVWICSGQSNMGRGLGPQAGQKVIVNWEQEVASANYPQIRHFAVKYNPSDKPMADVAGQWVICSPQTAAKFTAVGYYFGRDLHRKLGVPIGLMHTSLGGSPVEAWTRHEPLTQLFPDIVASHEKAVANYPAAMEKFKADEPKLLADWEKATLDAKAAGKPQPHKPEPPKDPAKSETRNSSLYNGMVAPLIPYAMRGVIWYQGEANAGRAKQYQKLFSSMIGDWRSQWNEGTFPFLFVQVAPYKEMNAEIREAQFLTWQSIPQTAMVVITDHGDANDVHPAEKEPVGDRLALAARAIAYKENIEYSGPVFEKLTVNGSQAVLSFSHLAGGLLAKDGPLKGFQIAGADGHFVPADATIEGDTVVVTNKDVPAPVSVTYGWTNVPDINLFNKEGLPASPFRSNPPPVR